MSDDDLDCDLSLETAAHEAETEEERAEEERLAKLDLSLLRRLCTEMRLYIRQNEMNAFWRMGHMVAERKRPLTARQRAWARTVEARARKLRDASRLYTNDQLSRLFAAMPSVPRRKRWRPA